MACVGSCEPLRELNPAGPRSHPWSWSLGLGRCSLTTGTYRTYKIITYVGYIAMGVFNKVRVRFVFWKRRLWPRVQAALGPNTEKALDWRLGDGHFWGSDKGCRVCGLEFCCRLGCLRYPRCWLAREDGGKGWPTGLARERNQLAAFFPFASVCRGEWAERTEPGLSRRARIQWGSAAGGMVHPLQELGIYEDVTCCRARAGQIANVCPTLGIGCSTGAVERTGCPGPEGFGRGKGTGRGTEAPVPPSAPFLSELSAVPAVWARAAWR
ncbi:hypothetical protein HJG60_012085 [Phyllostomus discolor]|uniref:Uncharacterized protein n=1 Tax=Phyllostomus discolor TaxID=89673 RepID=A0A833ZLX7_9CHIR|nr:hypothetical protein HJG60_012085 [Phyllostomus discolor]